MWKCGDRSSNGCILNWIGGINFDVHNLWGGGLFRYVNLKLGGAEAHDLVGREFKATLPGMGLKRKSGGKRSRNRTVGSKQSFH